MVAGISNAFPAYLRYTEYLFASSGSVPIDKAMACYPPTTRKLSFVLLSDSAYDVYTLTFFLFERYPRNSMMRLCNYRATGSDRSGIDSQFAECTWNLDAMSLACKSRIWV